MRQALERLIDAILDEAHDMTLATCGPGGAPHVTVVSFANNGLKLYFGCAPDSQKAQNLGAAGRAAATVTLPYKDWSQIRGLSLVGRARRLEDMAEIDAASLLFQEKFPEIARYAETSSQPIRIYELTPERISVLDYTRGFGHTERCDVTPADLVI
jgi:nitroimidazol reductase NimA-like FMN-containing flavoprotein (pyridoxamine 5'-phosphate oxidase superfamily)